VAFLLVFVIVQVLVLVLVMVYENLKFSLTIGFSSSYR